MTASTLNLAGAGAQPLSPRPARPHWLLLNCTVVGVLWLLTGFNLWSDRERTLADAFTRAETLRDALVEQSLLMVTAVDHALLGIVHAVDPETFADPEHTAANHAILSVHSAMAPGVLAFFLLDEAGRLVSTSRVGDREMVDLSDRSVYRTHQAGRGRGLYLGDPVIGRIGFAEGEPILHAGRRIETADGRFAGIAAAAVAQSYVEGFYGSLRIGPDGVVALVSATGTVLARSPASTDWPAALAGSSTPVGQPLVGAATGRFRDVTDSNGTPRLTTFGAVPGLPITVLVSLSEREELRSWRNRAYLLVPGSGLFGVAVIGLTLLLTQAARRREAAGDALAASLAEREAQARESGERLAALAKATLDLSAVTDTDALLKQIADVSRALTGAHQAVSSLTTGPGSEQAVHSVSLSDKYARWRDYDETPTGAGIYRLVAEGNRPMRLTQAELEAHPAWRGFGASRSRHPPMRGWLACPLVARNGRNLGMIQLSDRETGEFTEADAAVLQQLAQICSVAFENLQLYQALKASEEELRRAE